MKFVSPTSEASAAVPRGRVYSRYVGACGDERIKCLNPASFGKLVRSMFPDIKTRRLGVRGQSKYHYCGIKLLIDVPDDDAPSGQQPISTSNQPVPFNSELPMIPGVHADNSISSVAEHIPTEWQDL